jgi:hypothetical protein
MNIPLQPHAINSVISIARRPIWRENLLWAELAALLRDTQYRSPRPAGTSRSILLIPGFLTGDRHLGLMKGSKKGSSVSPP